jgi:Putative auto-transporter adhesin, head GIN domain
MKKLLVALCLLLGLSTVAQNVSTDKRIIKQPFSSIKVSDGVELILTQADEYSVNVSASEQKYLDELTTEVVNEKLVISVKEKNWSKSNNKNRWVKVKVSLPKLSFLDIYDGSNIRNTNKFNLENVEIYCNNGSAITLTDLSINMLKTTVNDGSTISITGKCTSLFVYTYDGSSFNGNEFITDTCVVMAQDGSTVKLNVEKKLTAIASDGSSILYQDKECKVISTTKDGSTIKKN